MVKSGKRAAIYTRVSTDNQTIENQLRELRQVAERRGWEVVEVYNDAGISGAKGRAERPTRPHAQRCQPQEVRCGDGLGDRPNGRRSSTSSAPSSTLGRSGLISTSTSKPSTRPLRWASWCSRSRVLLPSSSAR